MLQDKSSLAVWGAIKLSLVLVLLRGASCFPSFIALLTCRLAIIYIPVIAYYQMKSLVVNRAEKALLVTTLFSLLFVLLDKYPLWQALIMQANDPWYVQSQGDIMWQAIPLLVTGVAAGVYIKHGPKGISKISWVKVVWPSLLVIIFAYLSPRIFF